MSVMYVATLDILTEKGSFNPQAARAIGEAIDLEIARSRAATATREDLSELRRALSEEIGAHGVKTEKNISALRTELSGVRIGAQARAAVISAAGRQTAHMKGVDRLAARGGNADVQA